MRKFLIVTALLYSYCLPVFSQAPPYLPTDKLIGWWPFNGNAQDESGNGNDGEIYNAVLVNDRLGNQKSAYNFSGSDQWINVGSTEVFKLKSFTISAWINLNSFPIESVNNAGGILSQGGEGDANGTDANFTLSVHNYSGWSNGPSIYFGYETANGENIFANYELDSSYLHKWTHIVGTYDSESGSIKLFVDATLVVTISNITDLPNQSNYPALIGGGITTDSDQVKFFFDGSIDDVALWGKSLTDFEVGSLCYGSKNICQSTVIVNDTIHEKFTVVDTTVLPDHKGYWPLNANAEEVLYNKLNGEVLGCKSGIGRFGEVGTALAFDGISDIVRFNEPILPTDGSDWTLSLWFSSNDPNTNIHDVIFSQYLYNDTDMDDRFHIFVKDGKLQVFSGAYIDPLIAGDVVADQWSNIQVVVKNNYLSIYQDGIMYHDSIVIHEVQDTYSQLGFDNTSYQRYFSGSIDDMRIFNRAYTPDELKNLQFESKSICNATVTDTTYIDVVVTDTIHETFILNDTTVINKIITDTLYNTVEINDTVYYSVYDTVVLSVKITDTLYNTIEVNDTIYNTVYVNDTIEIATPDSSKTEITTDEDLNNAFGWKFTVAPNPASQNVNFTFSDELVKNGCIMYVYNIVGVTVFSTEINSTKITIPVSSIGDSGMYAVSILNSSKELVAEDKLVIEAK